MKDFYTNIVLFFLFVQIYIYISIYIFYFLKAYHTKELKQKLKQPHHADVEIENKNKNQTLLAQLEKIKYKNSMEQKMDLQWTFNLTTCKMSTWLLRRFYHLFSSFSIVFVFIFIPFFSHFYFLISRLTFFHLFPTKFHLFFFYPLSSILSAFLLLSSSSSSSPFSK